MCLNLHAEYVMIYTSAATNDDLPKKLQLCINNVQ